MGPITWNKIIEVINSTKPEYPKTMTIKKSPGYIRNGTDKTYTILLTLGKGDKLTALEKVKNSAGQTWYKVSYQGTTGFMVGNNLK